MTDQTVDESLDRNYEEEAAEMGWVPEDKFQGDKEKWIDAKTFVDRGEHILPILRENNKRLRKDLLTRDKKIATLESSLSDMDKAVKALQKHYTEATQQEVAKAEAALREKLKEARAADDVDTELEIQDKLAEIKDKKKEAKDAAENPPKDEGKGQQQLHPEVAEWMEDNPWFGDTTSPENKKRTKALTRIAEDLREDGETIVGKAFMEKCMEILEEQEGKKSNNSSNSRTSSKVEGARSGSGSGTGSRGFASLPKEAKDICHADNDRFVGPGKMFKTVKEWEDHFYKLLGD